MSHRVYFVDEDVSQLRPLFLELSIRDHEVRRIRDADSAAQELRHLTSRDLVFIDVMLAVNPDPERSLFGRSETSDYRLTGLILAERLLVNNPTFPPQNLVIFSHAASDFMLNSIQGFVSKHGCKFLRKGSVVDPLKFAGFVESLETELEKEN